MSGSGLHIGVDGNCWANRRGYGRYTRELLTTLLAVDRRNRYSFFLDAATAAQCDDLPAAAQQAPEPPPAPSEDCGCGVPNSPRGPR